MSHNIHQYIAVKDVVTVEYAMDVFVTVEAKSVFNLSQ
jgi:hypothetical protein